jgi:hypothetical protein
MYHPDFIEAKENNGRLYRDDKGNPTHPCLHIWLIYPVFEHIENYHAGFIPEKGEKFAKFEGICVECGEYLVIFNDNVVANNEVFEEKIKEILEEKGLIKETKKCKKKK